MYEYAQSIAWVLKAPWRHSCHVAVSYFRPFQIDLKCTLYVIKYDVMYYVGWVIKNSSSDSFSQREIDKERQFESSRWVLPVRINV